MGRSERDGSGDGTQPIDQKCRLLSLWITRSATTLGFVDFSIQLSNYKTIEIVSEYHSKKFSGVEE